jgi:hypothetical protein
MSFLAKILGTDPDSRIRKARKNLNQHNYSEARLELLELEHPDASVLMMDALEGLILLNLEEAEARSNSGDAAGAAEHMEMARRFGAQPDQIRAMRRTLREARETERLTAQSKVIEPPEAEGSDPLWSLTPDDPRLRFALMLETWPEEIRARLVRLGSEFADAALMLDDGQPALAAERLGPFVEKEVAVRLIRAQAFLAMGTLAPAASDLATLGQAIGHHSFGRKHTAVLLAQTLGQLGRLEEALIMVESEQARLENKDPVQLPLAGSRAALLEGLGQLEEAEKACEAVVLQAPRDMGLYRMLARIRVGLHNRMGAMQSLEAGLSTCCSSPGKCGNQPLDIQAVRMLARLYLEDRIEPERTSELLRDLENNVKQSGWEDRYLATLSARNMDDPSADRMAMALSAELGEKDIRQRWLSEQFQGAGTA